MECDQLVIGVFGLKVFETGDRGGISSLYQAKGGGVFVQLRDVG
jgi:hypothetical protein